MEYDLDDDTRFKLLKYLSNKDKYIFIKTDRGTGSRRAYLWAEYQLVKYFVEKKSDLNTIYEHVKKPLLHATLWANKELITYLVEHGVNINESDDHSSALIIACENGDLDIVKYLVGSGIEFGADVKTHTIVRSVVNNHMDLIKYLLDVGTYLIANK